MSDYTLVVQHGEEKGDQQPEAHVLLLVMQQRAGQRAGSQITGEWSCSKSRLLLLLLLDCFHTLSSALVMRQSGSHALRARLHWHNS